MSLTPQILISCNAKISRAKEHLETLRSKIGPWTESEPYIAVKEKSADGTRHSVVVHIEKEPELLQWSLIASDCIHNMRSALDHLLYTIGIYESKVVPPPEGDRLQFPIADSPEAYAKVKWRIKSLSLDVRTAIESVQPYLRPHAQIPPLLSLIRDFDNSNKHRLLRLAVSQAIDGQVSGQFQDIATGTPVGIVSMHIHVGGIVHGTEIVAFVTDRPAMQMEYKYNGTLVVALHHAKGPAGAPVFGKDRCSRCGIATSDFHLIFPRCTGIAIYLTDGAS